MRPFLSTYLAALRRRILSDERGDVPGWVLVTLMTAGLVIAIWLIAGPALVTVFETAIQRVLDF
ncbi:MAG TPA: hypothetical protein VK039_08030 [Brevibacterium sp.]|nr:hypothetical protein [Brevibacterium sp.]